MAARDSGAVQQRLDVRLCLAHDVVSPIVGKVVGLRLPVERGDHVNHG